MEIMRRRKGARSKFVVGFAVVFSSLFLPLARPVVHADAKIDEAVDKGIKYLLGQVQGNPWGTHTYGSMALETYALVVAGVPLDNRLISENFAKLNKGLKKSQHTYTLGCYIFALDAAIAQVETDYLLENPDRIKDVASGRKRFGKKYLGYMNGAVQSLVQMQNQRGAWRYGPGPDIDNSCTQFAILGLGIGARRGLNVPRAVWEKIQKYFIEGQQKNGPEIQARIKLTKKEERARRDEVDIVKKSAGSKSGGSSKKGESKRRGKTYVRPKEDPVVGTETLKVHQRGWDYQNKGGATWNMTCAGLSSMLIVRENLKKGGGDDSWKALQKSIRDGYGWVMGNWKLHESLYGMYSLEKAADIGGVELFGTHDWYKEARDHLISTQQPDGSWKGSGAHGEKERIATAYALLILRRATSLLTNDPGAGIVLTGQAAKPLTAEDREWVYVPSIDTSLHYPTIVKVLKRRASPKLSKFLGEIVKSYPHQHRGELVEPLAKALESVGNGRLERVFRTHLVTLTGLKKSDGPSEFQEWSKKWKRIHELVEKRKKGEKVASAELLEIYNDDTGSVSLKQTAAWALVRLNVKKAASHFFRDLAHESPEVRATAYSSFKSYFASTVPPFSPRGDEASRERQISAIRSWYRNFLERRKQGKK